MYEIEVAQPIGYGESSHVTQNSLRRPQSEIATEEILGGTEGARERREAPHFKSSPVCAIQLTCQVRCRRGKRVQILDCRRIGVAPRLAFGAMGQSGHPFHAPSTGQLVQQQWQTFVRLAAQNEVDEWESCQGLHVNHRRLGPTENDGALRLNGLDSLR